MYWVYVLRSLKTGRLYKGHTEDLEKRLCDHNAGRTRATRSGRPWEVVHREVFRSRQEAVAREKQLKTLAGGKELRKILGDMRSRFSMETRGVGSPA